MGSETDTPAEQTRLARAERDRALDAQARFALLARSSRILAESLDYEETLKSVAALALPYLGAWCIVDIVEGEQIRRLAVIHPDPQKQDLARRLHLRYPPDSDDVLGVKRVIESGRSEVVAAVSDRHLRDTTRDEEHLRLLRALGIGSYVIVPLVARGQTLGSVTFVTSEDDHRLGEADLTLAEDLACRSALALDNARLFRTAAQVRAEAERTSAIKDEFMAVMSHELRTPLTAILGFSELVLAGVPEPIGPKAREQVERISLSGRHLLQLVEEMLAFSRLEAGRARLALERVAPRELVQEVVGIMRPLAEQKGLELSFQLSADVPAVLHTDARKLRQILLNLLANAVKFTPRGRVELMVRPAGERLEIRIRDTGVGIAAEHLPRLFEPFWQADSSHTRERGGTGLGLTISERLAAMLGGSLRVESTPGEGSTFTVELPARGAEGAAPEAEEP